MQLRKNGSSEKKVKPPTTGPHFKERREKTPINIWKWLFLSLVSFLFATSRMDSLLNGSRGCPSTTDS